MILAIAIVCLCYTLLALWLRPAHGLFALLVSILFVPVIHVGKLSFRVEHIALPLALLVCVLRLPLSHWRGMLRTWEFRLYFAFWAWVCFSSVLGMAGGGHGTFSPVMAYAYARPCAMMLAASAIAASTHADPRKLARRLVEYFALAAPVCALFCICQVFDIPPARDLTRCCYTSATRPVFSIQEYLAEIGYTWRGTAMFENVAPAGLYFGLATLILASKATGQAPGISGALRAAYLFCALIALAGGFYTSSATFLFVLAGGMAYLILARLRRFRVSVLVIGVLGIGLVYVLYSWSADALPGVAAMFERKLQANLGADNFRSRFLAAGGALSPALLAVTRRPIQGYGFTMIDGVIVNDSVWVVVLFLGGAVGTALVVGCLVCCGRTIRRQFPGASEPFLWWCAFVFASVSSVTIIEIRTADWWWALVGILGAYNSYLQTRANHLTRVTQAESTIH